MPRRKLTREEEDGCSQSEYADLPPVLVQIAQKLRPEGIMWIEISSPCAVFQSGGRSYRGSGMGLKYRPGIRMTTDTGE